MISNQNQTSTKLISNHDFKSNDLKSYPTLCDTSLHLRT